MGRAKRQDNAGASMRAAGPRIPEGSTLAGWGEFVGDPNPQETEEVQTSILYVDSETGKLLETNVTVAFEYSGDGDVSEWRAELRSHLEEKLLQAAEEALQNGEDIDSVSASVSEESDLVPGRDRDHLDQAWSSSEAGGTATLSIEDDHQTREVPNGHYLLSKRKTSTRGIAAGRAFGKEPYVEPQLREIEARWSGTDPITGEEIEPGEKIYYDQANKKVYKRDNPFVSVGAEGRYLWHMWKENTDIDPVALASTWKMLRQRGHTPGAILRNQDGFMDELEKWKRVQLALLSDEERAEIEENGEIPADIEESVLGGFPSVQMLQSEFPTEELRAELEEAIASGKVGITSGSLHTEGSMPIDENPEFSEELASCLQMLKYRLFMQWHPSDWHNRATCYPGPWGKTTDGAATFPAVRRLTRANGALSGKSATTLDLKEALTKP